MTICITTDGFPPQPGGIATFNKHLVSLLLDAGHTVVVVTVDYINSTGHDEEKVEGQFIRIILRRSYYDRYKEWQSYFRPGGFDAPNWIATGMAMREWLLNNHKRLNIDITEASDYGGIGIFLTDADLPAVVLTGHGSLLQYSRYNYTKTDDSYKVVKKLEELSFTYADGVIAHSPLNKEDLELLFKREIMYSTIPWKFVPDNQQVITESNQLVTVGGLQPIKGIYDALETMKILKVKKPEALLHWIGGDTWMAPHQQQMSSYLQKKYPGTWQKNLIWKNELPTDITQKEISKASLVLIPAFFETFNYIALEAAALKKAIIITTGAGASSFFTHEQNAWIIPKGDPAAMAAAIEHLLENENLCRELGEQAYTMLTEKFAAGRILDERIKIYTLILQNRKLKNTGLHPELSFLRSYKTLRRKYYYNFRRKIKKIFE